MPFSMADLEALRQGLSASQKESTIALYDSAFAAFTAAGYRLESIHDHAVRIAMSRLDASRLRIDAADLVLRRDDGRVQRVMSSEPIEVVRYDEKTGILTAKVRMIKMTVLPYMDAAGEVVYEYKPAKEFATPAFMGGIPGRPVADLHPQSKSGSVTFFDMSDEQRALYTKGVLHTNPELFYVDGDVIVGIESIFDRDLIASLLDGEKVEVSAGVLAKVEERSGVFDGKAYTKVQTRPVFDHLAHVPRGRCGPDCRALISISDGAEEVSEESVLNAGGNNMPETKKPTDPLRIQVNDSLYMSFSVDGSQTPPTAKEVAAFQAAIDLLRTDAAQVPALQAKLDTAEREKAEMKTKMDAADGRADGKDDEVKTLTKTVETLQAKVDAAEKGEQAKMDSAIDDRLEMVELAREVVGDEYDFHGKDAQAIRVDVLKKLNPEVKLEGRSDDYVIARFDAAVDAFRKHETEPTGAGSIRGRNDQGGAEQTKRTARTDDLHRSPDKTPDGTK